MRKYTRIFAMITLLTAGSAAAPALYANDSQDASGSTTGNGMMGRDGMMGRGGMMGRDGMGSMMQMMENCGQMMQGMNKGSTRPNDQWKKTPPAQGEKI